MDQPVAREDEYYERPSGKYHEIEEPSRLLLRRAAEPPRPVLPKAQSRRTWTAKGRERDPLQSSLTGSGRAGKPGRLLGSSGGVYEGAVLAGRPHGWGRYYAPHPDPAKGALVLEYEGEFVRGQRTGQGTRHYAATGERYTGDWAAGRRHGTGRHEYAGGTVYEGSWVRDRREGPGRLTTAAGDVFVGTFVAERRQGLGVLYMVAKGKKLVGEWVDDAPVSATLLDLASDDLEPAEAYGLSDELSLAAARHRLASATGPQPEPAPLPPVHLEQPANVLARGFVAIRAARELGSASGGRTTAGNTQHSNTELGSMRQTATTAGRARRTSKKQFAPRSGGLCRDGTLSAEQLELLRHAFVLMTGSASRRARLLPRQLPELAVLAGLDPAAPATISLLTAISARGDGRFTDSNSDLVSSSLQVASLKQSSGALGASTGAVLGDGAGAGIGLDGLLHAAMHFRGPSLNVSSLQGGASRGAAGATGNGSQQALRLPEVEESLSEPGEDDGAESTPAGRASSGGFEAAATADSQQQAGDGNADVYGEAAIESSGAVEMGVVDDGLQAVEQWVEVEGGGVDSTIPLGMTAATVTAAEQPGTVEEVIMATTPAAEAAPASVTAGDGDQQPDDEGKAAGEELLAETPARPDATTTLDPELAAVVPEAEAPAETTAAGDEQQGIHKAAEQVDAP